MRHLKVPLLLSIISCSAYATDPAVQQALDRAVKQYPPGDYDNRPVGGGIPIREIHPIPPGTIEREIIKSVEFPKKDAPTLRAEAAKLFTQGRWDLASVRFKQILLLDPANTAAKANLYDIFTLECLWQTDTSASVLQKKYNELQSRISKEAASIAP